MGTLQYIVKQPLVEVAAEGKYDIFVNVIGGGYTGQAGAIRLGIARALLQSEPEVRPPSRRQASSPVTPASRSARSTVSRRRAEHLSSPRDNFKEIARRTAFKAVRFCM